MGRSRRRRGFGYPAGGPQVCIFDAGKEAAGALGDKVWCGPLVSFARCNRDAPDVVKDVRKLKVGARIRVGGSAGLLFDVFRPR